MWKSHRLLNKYLFLFNVGGLLSLDHVLTRWDLLRISGIDQRGSSLADAVMAADPRRCGRNHDIRVPDRLHREFGF